MNHRLHLRFEQLERATNQLFGSIEALGSRAYQVPGPGRWSAAQVAQHLILAETGIGQYIEKKLLQAEGLAKTNFLTSLRSLLLRGALRLPFLRFKAPARLAALMPAEVPELPQLRTEWERTRRHLERLLNEFPAKLLPNAIFRHPRSGMLNIYQTLDFMLDHVLHHQRQVGRIAQSLQQ